MTGKERIKRGIRFEQTDCIPWQINCTTPFAERLLKAFGREPPPHATDPFGVRRQGLLDEILGNHITYVRNRGVNSVREVRPGIWRDEWGVLWDRTIDRDIGTPTNSPLAAAGSPGHVAPDPDDPDRYAHVQPIIESAPGRYILAKFSYSLFERAWSLRGMEELLMDFAENPAFVHELMQSITDFNLKVMENLARYPIDGIQFGDDWGSQKAMIMSPAMWRCFVRPYAAAMYARAHSLGLDVFIHSCGRITEILDDLAEIGVDVVNPLQTDVVSVDELFPRYARRLAFYGGLSVQKTLPFGTRAVVQRETRQMIALGRAWGGLIVSPTHDVPPDVPIDNVIALLDVVRAQ